MPVVEKKKKQRNKNPISSIQNDTVFFDFLPSSHQPNKGQEKQKNGSLPKWKQKRKFQRKKYNKSGTKQTLKKSNE